MLNFQATSGLLQSSTVTYQGVPIYFNGRGDLGRTPMFSQTDLLINHDFRMRGNRSISLQMNVTNLFDQKTATGLAFAAYRDALVIPNFASRPADAFFQPGGFDTVAIQAARLPASGRPSPIYGQANAFQGARSIRVMARLGVLAGDRGLKATTKDTKRNHEGHEANLLLIRVLRGSLRGLRGCF